MCGLACFYSADPIWSADAPAPKLVAAEMVVIFFLVVIASTLGWHPEYLGIDRTVYWYPSVSVTRKQKQNNHDCFSEHLEITGIYPTIPIFPLNDSGHRQLNGRGIQVQSLLQDMLLRCDRRAFWRSDFPRHFAAADTEASKARLRFSQV